MRNTYRTLAVGAVMVAGLATAGPAYAVASGSLAASGGSVVVTYSGLSGSAYLNICASSVSAGACLAVNRTYFATNASGGTTLGASPATIGEGSTVKVGSSGATTAALPAGTYRMDLFDSSGSVLLDSNVFTIGAGGAADSSSTSSATPAPILQAFGKPASGTCDAAAPESLNWAGVASGGWRESWGRWEGYEGPACVRTLVYSNNLGHWVVA